VERKEGGGPEPLTSPASRRHPDSEYEIAEYKLKLTKEGWQLDVNGKRIKIFTDILGDEANRIIAEALGISVNEAWKLKNQALETFPQTLDDIRNLFPQIVGEDQNVKLMVLALFSTKLRNPDERIMGVIIESPNSAGKSYFAKAILKPLRGFKELVLEFTRVTGAYLERKFKELNLDRRILFIQETNNAPSQLHLSLSEGKLRVGIVERVDGGFTPIEIEADGQPFLLATTTSWRGGPDLVHRCILMNLDESADQTYRILNFQAKLNSDYIYKQAFENFVEGCSKVFKLLWKAAPENVDVVIPYSPLIEEKLKVVENPDVKLRRDFNKLIALIKANAILFARHRKLVKLGDRLIIVADIEDFKQVFPLFETSFKQTLVNLSEKEERVLQALKERDGSATYTELARDTRIPSSTLRHHIVPRLEAKGFVVVEKSVRPHRIERVKNLQKVTVEIDESTAKKMVNDAVASLLLSGGQMASHEKSLNKASTKGNKPEESAIYETAKDLGVSLEKIQENSLSSEKETEELAKIKMANNPSLSSQNKPGEGSTSLWQNGHEVNKEVGQK